MVGYLIPVDMVRRNTTRKRADISAPRREEGIAAHKVGILADGIHGQGGIIYKAYQYELFRYWSD